jgi:hypothetical protein
MSVDEIFDRVRSLDETTAVWLLSGGDIYGDE